MESPPLKLKSNRHINQVIEIEIVFGSNKKSKKKTKSNLNINLQNYFKCE